MDLVSFRMATSTGLRLWGCDLRDGDLYAAEMPDSQFLDCDLTGADITSATLGASELHRSRLDGLTGALALRDVVVDPVQAVLIGTALLAAHGITVTDEPAEPR
jgi:uncharacterized protein YjbI with pentapeptide repeats